MKRIKINYPVNPVACDIGFPVKKVKLMDNSWSSYTGPQKLDSFFRSILRYIDLQYKQLEVFMDKKLKKREPELKLKVAIEALKGELSINQIASKYEIHPKQVTDWRDQLLNEGELVFTPKTSFRRTKTDHEKDDLLLKIGQLSVEVDYLKKKLNC